MSDSTRRTFLAVAGAGTVAGVAAIAAPAADAAEPVALPAGAQGAMAAYVRDVRRGEVVVMVEGREVVLTDHRLVAGLARAFARAERT